MTSRVHKLRHAWQGLFRPKFTPTPSRHAPPFSDLAASRCFLHTFSVFEPCVTLDFCPFSDRATLENFSKLSTPPPLPLVTRDVIYKWLWRQSVWRAFGIFDKSQVYTFGMIIHVVCILWNYYATCHHFIKFVETQRNGSLTTKCYCVFDVSRS